MSAAQRTAALAGGIAMAFALLVAYLASIPGIPFAPTALGQALVEVLPGWISVPLIELLKFWAERLLVVGVLGLFMIAGAAAGIVAGDARRRDASVVALGALPWLAAFALGQLFASAKVDLAASLLDAAVGAVAFFAGLAFLTTADRVATPASTSRRRVLVGAISVAAILAAGSLALGSTARAVRAKAEGIPLAARRLRAKAAIPPAEPAFEAVEKLTTRITENRDHYTVDTALIKPRVDAATWRLEIGGAVEQPYAIGYDDLLDMEAIERPHTLECISNEIGGDLTSTAVWTGVPMRDLLARAKPKGDTFDVVLRSVDGYSDSVRLEKAMEEGTLVAYLMNGYTLPEEHGYPARVLIPNIYGMKNVKWLAKIELVTFDYQGYWMERGWSDVAIYNTHARIDVPGAGVRWSGGIVPIAGIAFAGARGIQRVEVSTDGGASWADAALEPALGPHTWRRWRYDWTPAGAGRYKLRVRATDGDGQVQTATRRPPFPAGSTGYDSIEVTVARG